jgi:triosephosphate isomerase
MNLDRAAAVELARGVAQRAGEFPDVALAVCPPSVYLAEVGSAVAGTPLELGAQNMYHEPSGAYTGEISASMLRDVGCSLVILGHSERRHILGETDEDVNRKVHAALAAGLVPIVCVGELLEQRTAGQTNQVIHSQFDGSLAGLTAEQMAGIVIAYEPVWAIGTGQVATPQQAEQVHVDLRNLILDRYNAGTAAAVCIQYGGSVKAANAAELLAQPNIDGALVGGASLNVDEFLGIAAASRKSVSR